MIFKSDQYFESKTDAGYCVRLTSIETGMEGFKTVELVDLSGREFKMSFSDFKRAYYFGDDKTEPTPPEEPSKPAHYDTAIDPITFAKANFSREAVGGFMRINAIKYLQRDKGETLSDLRKARHFIDMLIEMEEEGE